MIELGHNLCAARVDLFILRLGQLLADHEVCELLPVGIRAIDRSDDLAEAQDRDTIGNAQHLAHFVADKDDGFSFSNQLVHDCKQALDLDIGQRRRRLVENQELRPMVERLENFGPLLLADGNIRDKLVELHVETVFFGQRLNFLPARGAVDEDALCVLVAEDDIVEHRHCLDEHEVLMHHADAELDRLAGRIDADLLPIEENLALGRLVEADENVHERRFARAVFSKEGVYLTFCDREIDVLIGIEIAEPFADVLHAKQLFQSSHSPFR